MRYLILLFIFTTNIFATDADNRDAALKESTKAIMSIPTIRHYRKNLEEAVLGYIPFDKDTVATIGSIGLTAAKGEIDTKVLKKMEIKALGGKIRPDLKYNFRDNVGLGTLRMNWDF